MKKVRIIASQIIAKDLQPGDLFSTEGPEYWTSECMDDKGVGERVYIRTNRQSSPAPDPDLVVYKIIVEVLDA